MPEISRFFGIVTAMVYDDHAPPCFDVRNGGERALIEIESLTLLEGRLSPRALGLINERASSQEAELLED